MSLSRFCHFNNAVYSGFSNEKETSDSEENGQLNNGGMIITAGWCTRSRHYLDECSEITGSFSSVTVEASGQIVRCRTTVVRPDNAGSSSVHILPLGQKSLEIWERNNIGHVNFGIEQINGHLGSFITSPICDPYVDYSEVQENNNNNHTTVDIEEENRHLGPSITLPVYDPYVDDYEEWCGRNSYCNCTIL